MVAAVFRTIFAQPDAKTVAATWDEVRDQLSRSFPKVGPLMDDAKAEVLAFTVNRVGFSGGCGVSRVPRSRDSLDSHATVMMRLRSNSIGVSHPSWL